MKFDNITTNIPNFYSGLDTMTSSRRHSGFFRMVNLDEMIGLLEDLTTYFAQPSEEEELSKKCFYTMTQIFFYTLLLARIW